MTRRSFVALGAVPAVLAAGRVLADGAPMMTVAKSPTCGCCSAWVRHMREAGFRVTAEDMDGASLERMKAEAGLAPALRSCHTAQVEGYVIEGHVPAEDVLRLLAERPEAIGLAVPGMPIGSPGMEMGARSEPYDVLLVERDGGTEVFASHR